MCISCACTCTAEVYAQCVSDTSQLYEFLCDDRPGKFCDTLELCHTILMSSYFVRDWPGLKLPTDSEEGQEHGPQRMIPHDLVTCCQGTARASHPEHMGFGVCFSCFDITLQPSTARPHHHEAGAGTSSHSQTWGRTDTGSDVPTRSRTHNIFVRHTGPRIWDSSAHFRAGARCLSSV